MHSSSKVKKPYATDVAKTEGGTSLHHPIKAIIQEYEKTHEKQCELLRYLVAGGLTTLLSLVIHYGMCFLLVFVGQKLVFPLSVVDTINRASPVVLSIATTFSWVISVLFAYWINKGMVFRFKNNTKKEDFLALLQFAGSRLLSFFLFEQGMMLLLKAVGVSNMLNRLVVLVFVMVFNYVVSKFFIFKK